MKLEPSSEPKGDHPVEELEGPVVGLTRESHMANQLPSVLIRDFENFQSEQEVRKYIDLLLDRQQAEAVLRMIVANTASETIEQADEIQRIQLAPKFGVQFDAYYLWEQMEDPEKNDFMGLSDVQMSVGAITVLGTFGYLIWSLRGGVLIAAVMSQLPTWQLIDPLPVLETYENGREKNERDEFDEFFT